MTDLTQEFIESEIEKFKILLESSGLACDLSSLDLERWVTAYEGAEKALPAFKACLRWREEHSVDEMMRKPPSANVAKQMISGKAVILPDHLKDDCGRPVMLCNPTKHDKKTKLRDTIEHMIYCLELICDAADRQNIKDMCIILDLNKFGVTDMDYALAKTGLKTLVNYYPERLGALYMINTPAIFHGFYKIIQRWLYPRTKEKIRFVPGKIHIDEWIETGVLPPQLFDPSLTSDPELERCK